jgi:hypothetical protein
MSKEPLPTVQSAELDAFATLAEEYCELIERRSALDRDAFLQSVHLLLPRLYAAALRLPSTNILFTDDGSEDEDDEVGPQDLPRDPDRVDTDAWRELFHSLGEFIGKGDLYREVYDPYEPPTEPEVTGSLADDLADIYRDLLAGLHKWRRGESGEALWEWRFHFEGHWGEHLTGAMRALYTLSSTYELDWPENRSGAA